MAKELTEKQFEKNLETIRKGISLELKPIKKLNKTKETIEMKNPIKKAVIATVLVTLVTIAAFAGTFYMGVSHEKNRQATVATEATKLVEQLKSQSE